VKVQSLPPQPASLDVRETSPDSGRMARRWQAFAIGGKVSGLLNPRNARTIRQKSPAIAANIPVFGETAIRDRVRSPLRRPESHLAFSLLCSMNLGNHWDL
jgi:hypothetical protein